MKKATKFRKYALKVYKHMTYLLFSQEIQWMKLPKITF